jgi:ABC-type multidrug transport system fused ATPase/permease subunit
LCALAFQRAEQLDWGNISSRSASSEKVKANNDEATATSAPIGRISELMGKSSGDVIAYYDALICLLILPFEIFASIGILIFFVGWSGLGAMAVLLVSIFVSHVSGQVVETISAQKGESLASFSSSLNEVLVGIMTIRLSGWTRVFHARLIGYSARVEDLSDNMALWVWASSGMHNTSVDVMSLAIVLLYVLVAGNTLTPASYTAYVPSFLWSFLCVFLPFFVVLPSIVPSLFFSFLPLFLPLVYGFLPSLIYPFHSFLIFVLPSFRPSFLQGTGYYWPSCTERSWKLQNC